jgi:hypothetical protein
MSRDIRWEYRAVPEPAWIGHDGRTGKRVGEVRELETVDGKTRYCVFLDSPVSGAICQGEHLSLVAAKRDLSNWL